MKKAIYILLIGLLSINVATAQQKEINRSLEVGTLLGSLGVSPTGAAKYTIPIEVPPGINGMTPEIGFVYNSRGGDGIMGKGWGFGGLSAISRTANTYYFNDYPKEVNFAGDQLTLDGKKMIKVNQQANEYRFEVDDMTKIIKTSMKSNLRDGIKYVAYTKAGLIKTYGGSDESHLIYNNNANAALMYYLSSIEDQFGNYIHYNYSQNIEMGTVYLESITYANDFVIDFEYENLSNALTKTVYFTYGAQSNDYYQYKNNKRLTKIVIRQGSNEIRSYNLNYNISGQLDEWLLNSITLFAGDDKIPSTVFSWKENLSGINGRWDNFSGNITPPPGMYRPTYFENGDYNNDGITDKAIYYFHSDVHNNKSTLLTLTMQGISTEQTFNMWIKPISSGDFNGDGTDELFFKDGEDYKIAEYIYNPETNTYDIDFSIILYSHDCLDGYTSDFNGDGLTDYIYYDKNGTGKLTYYIGDSDDFLVITDIVRDIGTECEIYTGDFDGEGKMELLVLKDAANFFIVELNSNNTEFIQHNIGLTSDETSSFSKKESRRMIKDFFRAELPSLVIGDFNQDGKTDIITTYSNSSELKYYFSFGYNFLQKKTRNMPNDGIFASDVNGDGITDIITLHLDEQGDMTYMNGTYHYHNKDGITLVNGPTFTLFENVQEEGTSLDQVSFGDYTGTGKNDLAFASHTQGIDPFYGIDFNVTTCYYGDISFNKITDITTGLGAKTKITYEALPQTEHYSSDNLNLSSQLKQLTPTFYVVTKVQTNNGAGGYFLPTEYEYKNAIAHRLGKGFLGFQEFIVKNGIANNYSRNVYEIYTGDEGNQFYHPYRSISEQYVMDDDGTPLAIISRTINDLDNLKHYTDKRLIFHYVKKSTTEQFGFETGIMYKHIEITKENYDEFGNPGKIVMTKSDNAAFSVSTHKSESEFLYWNNVDNWVLGRLYDINVTKQWVGNTTIPASTKHSIFSYYEDENLANYGKLKSETLEPEDPNSFSKEYQYDDYGNTWISTVDSYNSPSTETQRKTEIVFGSIYNHRFATNIFNPLRHETKKEYDGIWGRVTKSTDPNEFEVISHYNSFGKLTSIDYPDNTSLTTETQWVSAGDEDKPENASYFVRETIDGSSPVVTYFDMLNRKLRNVAIGLDGKHIFTDFSYSIVNGLLHSNSKPYFKGEEELNTYYYYDDLNRMVGKLMPGNRMFQKQYIDQFVLITNPNDQITAKMYDVNDNPILLSDNYNPYLRMYNANGKIIETTLNYQDNTKISCKYDIFGQLIEIVDPALGKKEYKYNCFGELTEVKHNEINEASRFIYDKLGRLLDMDEYEFGHTNYVYDAEFIGLPDEVSFANSENGNFFKNELIYDELARNTEITETVTHNGNTDVFTTSTTYDQYSRPEHLTYPSGFSITHRYNEHGYLNKIIRDIDGETLWEIYNLNALAQPISSMYGNFAITKNEYYPETGFLKRNTVWMGQQEEYIDMHYDWDNIGNLKNRKRTEDNGCIVLLTELFGYDQFNRLTNVNLNRGEATMELEYDALGRILYKKSSNTAFHVANSYNYDNEGTNPYKLLEIDNKPAFYNPVAQSITYTKFDKINNITQYDSDNYKTNELNIFYGLGHKRKIQEISDFENQEDITKIYIGGIYEKVTTNQETKHIHYLSGTDGLFAIYTKIDQNNDKLNYVHKDHLGSIIALTDEDGALIEEYSYDAWGLRRDPETWIPYETVQNTETDRGFTGHEHLDAFAMVNMNGRIYDPVIGYFSSPDPVIGIPGNSQGYNLYTYVFNNPLSYIDPTGFLTTEINDIGAGPIYTGLYSTVIDLAETGAFNDETSFYAGVFVSVFDEAIANGASIQEAGNIAKQAASAAFAQSSYGISSNSTFKSADAHRSMMSALKNGGGAQTFGNGSNVIHGHNVGSQMMANSGSTVTSGGQTKFNFSKTVAQSAIAGSSASIGNNANAGGTITAYRTLDEVEVTSKRGYDPYNQTAGMIQYGTRDGLDGPGGGYTADYQYNSVDLSIFWTTGWESVAVFGEKTGDFFHGLFTPKSPFPHGYTTINKEGLDSVYYGADSGIVFDEVGEQYFKKYTRDGVIIDSGSHWIYGSKK